mmetsp:Transcript_9673/g.21490  ORF Transcript_9673/g.21490 Transcript_9673/m.21490 type:complete len:134 (-) Transcript_9673:728-1129(-)
MTLEKLEKLNDASRLRVSGGEGGLLSSGEGRLLSGGESELLSGGESRLLRGGEGGLPNGGKGGLLNGEGGPQGDGEGGLFNIRGSVGIGSNTMMLSSESPSPAVSDNDAVDNEESSSLILSNLLRIIVLNLVP